ncbi:ABC transporter permease [Leeuwenhoekiella aequorea]|uniref:Transport permease protein n=1 Tax=Leeuwenhoekiella aequorea TaxID=283736 RepID=A0A4Q0PDE3_9FLAO|nr:ABC transporter permease [Leeuwenhoekiella aequorea]RXG24890.1 lipopolysaccharide transport system permease protein [Leeuwenhoekiella aequorea]
MKDQDEWLYEINAKQPLIDIDFKEIWRYRDLLYLFVRRDIISAYKQTILGPLWYLIQPLFTGIIFTLVFNNIASISTGGAPPFLFNLAGITMWSYFAQCLNNTSNTFASNAGLFSKVYFPRIISPMSQAISALFKLSIQLFIFACFYMYFVVKGSEIQPNSTLWFFPVLLLIVAVLGLGAGMLISSLTTKYRDFRILIGFATTLLMYISAVMYPISEVRNSATLAEYTWVVELNPIAILIEAFRYMTLSEGLFEWPLLTYCSVLSLVLFFVGLIVFNRTGKNFIDTI